MVNSNVWEVYDLWRTSKLNVKYYSSLQSFYTTVLKTFDITLAITAPSGTIAGLWFWENQYGSILWKAFIILASVVSLIKPFCDLTEKVKKTDTVLSGYKMMTHDIEVLINQIKHNHSYKEEEIKIFNEIYKRKGVLITQDPQIKGNKRRISLYMSEINEELMNYKFYIPEVEYVESSKAK